ncbi:MAG: HU family DNA-binding protein [Limnochordia bacterium]
MTKTDLVDQGAAKSNLTKKDAGAAVDAVFASITEALAKGDKVQLVGFGSFEVKQRSERVGRNPQTGAEMTIPAKKVPVFRAGKQLKDSVGT